MWRKLLSKNFIPYTITLLVVAVDFVIVAMVTFWSPQFTVEKLKTSGFWLEMAVKLIITLIAYFSLVYFSSTIAGRSKKVEMLHYQIGQNYDFIIINLLTNRRDEFIDLKNSLEKAKAYINYLDVKLRKLKEQDPKSKKAEKIRAKRAEIVAEKERVAVFIQLTAVKLSEIIEVKELSDEQLEQGKAFNVNGIKEIPYFKIDKSLLDGLNSPKKGRVLGHFDKAKYISGDIALKIIPTMTMTIVMSLYAAGVFSNDANAIQSAVFLSLIILMNCLFGWLAGNTLVMKYGVSMLNEIKIFYGDFFNYCVFKHDLNKQRLIEHNERLDTEIKQLFYTTK